MSSSDEDSAFGDDSTLESSISLTSSILNHTYENGRRYHAYRAGQYFMPNDDQEQEAMDLMHHISSLILRGALYRAPVSEPLEILEIGTGNGVWAIDVADRFPSARVLAIDLSPIQPEWIPSNLIFEVDDCESEWSISRQFDFVHIRNLGGAILDWPKLLRNCYEHLKPGGWLECSNIETFGRSANHSLTEESASSIWQTNLNAAAGLAGRTLNIGPELENLIKDACFETVTDYQYQVPMSRWTQDPRDQELAEHFQCLVFLELEALSLRLYTQVLGWTPEALEVLLVDVRKEIRNPRYQLFSTMHYVTGRKIS